DVISFKMLFLISAGLGLCAFLLASTVKYKKVDTSRHKTKPAKFTVFEKNALNPSFLLFFITATFGGIASFLPLYAEEKGIAGISFYFITYAAFLMLSRLFAGKIYDMKCDLF